MKEALIVAILHFSCVKQTSPPVDLFDSDAKNVISEFKGVLVKELKNAIDAGGPAHAITGCSQRTAQITQQLSTNGLRLKRIGTRIRNARTNTSTDAERQVLKNELTASAEWSGDVDGKRTYMRAIRIRADLCLQCHGDKQNIASEVAGKQPANAIIVALTLP
ncbi:DUF3365 domain-containing protein [Myxococcota bacterium]